MIISHSGQFCFWKIPRTGSNTAELCIRMSGVLDLSVDIVVGCWFYPQSHNVPEAVNELRASGHTTPDEAIKSGALTEGQYADYDHYCMVREPVSRWVSAYAFHHRYYNKPNQRYLNPLEFFEQKNYFENTDHSKTLVSQSSFLNRGEIKTVPFSDYENSIRSILDAIGAARLEDVPRLEHQSKRCWKQRAWNEIDRRPELKQRILERYAADVHLDY